MVKRRGLSSILSEVGPADGSGQAQKSSAFDRFMQTSPLDADPGIMEIARQVSAREPLPSRGRTDEQVNRAGQLSRTTEQDNRAGQLSRTTEHLSRTTEQVNRAPEQDNRAGQLSRSTEQVNRAGKPSRTTEQVNRAGQLSRSTEHPDDTDPPRISLLQPPPIARTHAQKKLLAYFEGHGSHISNYAKIIEETGLSLATVRRDVERLSRLGYIRKQLWRQGAARGLAFDYLGENEQDNRAGKPSRTTEQVNRAGKLSRTNEQDNRAPCIRKIDRSSYLSISLEGMAEHWPNLVRCGFGPDQLAQIEDGLALVGKSTERVFQGLDHAEWELANATMCDKDGQPVADPCAWVYRALVQTGYYRRPKGYVSPEEQYERDQETEAKARAQARENAREARFQAWCKGLSAQDREMALEGHRGPVEQWLKNVWSKRGEPE